MKTETDPDSTQFIEFKNRKLSKIKPMFKGNWVSMSNYCYNFIDERADSKGISSKFVSSHPYDENSIEIIKEFENGMVLDCGAGLRNDYYTNIVNFEIEPYSSTDVIGNGESLPFLDDTFDAVLSLNVLEHVQDPFACAREICRVLKPGGKIYCVAAFMQPFHAYPSHYFNMTAEGMSLLFKDFVIIDEKKVLLSGHPIFSLTWYLQSWVRGLPNECAQEFLDLTVRHLIQDPMDLLDQNYVTKLAPESVTELAATTAVFAHKPLHGRDHQKATLPPILTSTKTVDDGDLRYCFHERLHTWCIDNIKIDNSKLEVSGWINLNNAGNKTINFFCNNSESKNLKLGLMRPDLGKLFPFWEDADNAGFKAQFDLPGANTFEFEYRVDGKVINSRNCNIFYPNLKERFAYPDEIRRQRVHGAPGIEGFKIEGYSAYKKIVWVMENELKLKLNQQMEVLDWGSGCGRLTRFLCNDSIRVSCADIDLQNLEWCEKNLPIVPLPITEEPNGSLPTDRYDVILGVSVMSHLDQIYQLKWLKELYKSLKKGGCLILTTHGICSALRRLDKDEFIQFITNGFFDAGANPSLLDTLPNNSSYKDTYTAIPNIVNAWTNGFTIASFNEALIGNNQDLVILKKN